MTLLTYILLAVIVIVVLIDLYLKRKNKLATTKEIEKVVDKENPEKKWWKNKVIIIISSVVLGAGLVILIPVISNEVFNINLFNPSTEEEYSSGDIVDPSDLADPSTYSEIKEITCSDGYLYKDFKKRHVGICKLKYHENKVSYIFTLNAGYFDSFYDITEHPFYNKFVHRNISLSFYDDNGFPIEGPKILWNDIHITSGTEEYNDNKVFYADGFMQMNESDFNSITNPFGGLKFE